MDAIPLFTLWFCLFCFDLASGFWPLLLCAPELGLFLRSFSRCCARVDLGVSLSLSISRLAPFGFLGTTCGLSLRSDWPAERGGALGSSAGVGQESRCGPSFSDLSLRILSFTLVYLIHGPIL